MIHTASYFNKQHHHGELISISNTMPKGFTGTVETRFKSAVPDWDLVKQYKNGEVTWEEYSRQYLLMLEENWDKSIIDRLAEYNNGRDCTLLCWCKDKSRCHRSLLAEFLQRKGFLVKIN